MLLAFGVNACPFPFSWGEASAQLFSRMEDCRDPGWDSQPSPWSPEKGGMNVPSPRAPPGSSFPLSSLAPPSCP